MSKSPVSEYGFINAKLRTRMGAVLTEEFRKQMQSATGMEEAVQVLQNYGFEHLSEVWRTSGDIQNVEYALFVRHLNNYKSVLKSTTGNVRQLVNLLASKPEIENIKNALRLWYGSQVKKRPVSYRSAYIHKERIYEDIDWTSLINAVSVQDIQEVFDATIYSSAFGNAESVVQENGIFPLEIQLDKIYYSRLLQESRFLSRADYAVLKDIVSSEIDLQNIGWIIRYRHYYSMDFSRIQDIMIPGASPLNLKTLPQNTESRGRQIINPAEILQKQYSGLEFSAAMDKSGFSAQAEMFEYLLDETRKAQFSKIITGYPFTVGIIFAYFFLCEREQRFIAAELNGKFYKKRQTGRTGN